MFPPRAVLAAVDFSDPARVALSFAGRLAKHCQGQLHVLHVLDPLLEAAARSSGIDLARETKVELVSFMVSAFPAGDWAPSHHVVSGSAVEGICHIAARENADLIVVGARGLSGVRLPIFGSTAEGVLRKADTSVLVVPENWTPPRSELNDLTGMGPVVVGLEMTAAAIEAARSGATLAKLLNTSVEFVHVVPALPALSRWSAHADAALQQRVERARHEMASALRCLSEFTSAAVRVETGSVNDRLAEAVAASGGRRPLLVLGRRTRAERGGAPGSTAYRVLTQADVPVLMCLPEQ